MNIKTLPVAVFAFIMLTGCTTTQTLFKADRHKRHVTLVSSSAPNALAPVALKNQGIALRTRKLVKKLRRRKSDVPKLITISQLYLATKKLNLAEKYCKIAIRYDIKNQEPRKILAQIEIAKDNLELAFLILNGIGGYGSDDSEVANMLAQIELANGNQARAMHLFKKAIELDSDNLAARHNLAIMYIQYRQIEAAGSELERILKVMPNHPDVLFTMAIVQTSRGEFSEAESSLSQVLQLKENHPLALYNLALLQKRTLRFDDAIRNLKNYIKTDYARSMSPDHIFALMDQVERERQESEGRFTDEQIGELAAQQDASTQDVAINSSKEPDGESVEFEDVNDSELEQLERELSH
jgi:tetratricopeptide (TPR) repeat protein